ncbi:unnamed protein product [Caenorhabditis angaria]|uniref:Integrator complex subunit 7 N-terminal domain-containing protein n=1 Tax=Caenorhabditis angaria TaxID=860376 RepID=A0A9P1IDN2_9PELO|nr:unnamed protein product [Caenorhabditis angaria]
MAGANVILQNFDKGLRAHWPPEQLATIARLSRLFEENPVPTFVNSMLLRLADCFKDGTNDVRVSIARALGQCGSQLTLAFSSAEIFRRILVVSHSNDPNAREATLDVLSAIAPIFPESGQAHHIICESMNTSHDGEFRAACSAMKSFAQLSSMFSEDIVLRIGKLLEDSAICERRKIEICKVFSTMCANATTMDYVFDIVDNIINRNISDSLLSEFLEATTSLCIEIRYAIPKQIDNLLNILLPIKEDCSSAARIRMLIILRELKRLAEYSNIWKEEQVETF